LVLILALALVSIVALVPIFIVVRTQGAVSWNWGAVFVPIWILLALYVAVAIGLIFLTKGSKVKAVKFALQAILLTLFVAFLCARLNGTTKWDSGAYLSPLYIIEALNAISIALKSTKSSYYQEAQGGEGEGATKRSYIGLGYFGFLIRQWFWWIHKVWFLIFLTVQLHYEDWSWWIPAIPLITAITFGFFLRVADDKVAAALPQEEEEAEKGGKLFSFLVCLLGSLAIVFIGLLATHLTNGKFSMAVVFIPVFIVLGLLLCCCFCCMPCFCCCFMANGNNMDENDQRRFMPDLFSNRQRLMLTSSPPSSPPASPASSSASSPPAFSASSSSSSSSSANPVAPIPVIVVDSNGPLLPIDSSHSQAPTLAPIPVLPPISSAPVIIRLNDLD